jgi:alcohol dehydrogenase
VKALVYHGPGEPSWQDYPDPDIIDPTDAIVRVDAVTICGTDLHILKGDVPGTTPGRVLGHEAVGTIVETGMAVGGEHIGERVLLSCISSCGRCEYCRAGRYGQCRGGGGWILGHLIDGVQAEYVRVPFADTSTYRLPQSVTDEAALLLADVLPTAYEVGVLSGRVSPGQSVAVVGAGPIGLAAITTAKLLSPSLIVAIDKARTRCDAAKSFGADISMEPDEQCVEQVMAATDGLGVDVAIEAVGTPAAFELCTKLVHGRPATLHLEDLWIKDVTITTGLVDTSSTTTLLKMTAAGRFDTGAFITHRFGLDEMQEAYDVFARSAETGALKVALLRK